MKTHHGGELLLCRKPLGKLKIGEPSVSIRVNKDVTDADVVVDPAILVNTAQTFDVQNVREYAKRISPTTR